MDQTEQQQTAEAQAQGGGDAVELMTGDLLPCPFCGKSNQDRWPCEWLDGSGANVIRCAWCHGAAPLSVWNRRTAPPSVEAMRALKAKYQQHIDADHFPYHFWRDLEAALAERPEALDQASPGYYLASFKRSAHGGEILWWGPDNAGYTPDLLQAGIYTKISPGYHDSDDTVPVPVAFIDTLRVRHMVDPGDSLNRPFWSAADLRAALAQSQGERNE